MSGTVTALSLLDDIGRGLREALSMLWATLWALALGFLLSGVVQAFVPRSSMRARLGTHRPAAVTRATGYGMASSSCSYAAAAMARSLFAKGADFVTAMVFMVASTNLVVELALVLLVLLGWQFVAAEYVGGPIMIALLVTLGAVAFSRPLVDAARRHARATESSELTDYEEMADEAVEPHAPLRAMVRTRGAWADAAGHAMADLRMLRRELLLGFTVAGFLAALVPAHAWESLFLHGHGIWTSLENALVAPVIAVVSWVCSIGNVPLAAALWSGGISFGGVVAFLFADLIAMPLLLVYRKLYGTRMMLRLLVVLYGVMVVAGLATGALFAALGWVPSHHAIRVTTSPVATVATAVLNVVFVGLAAAAWWLARSRSHGAAAEGMATDPVCGMPVRVRDAPSRLVDRTGATVVFCSEHCASRFRAGRAGDAAPHGAS